MNTCQLPPTTLHELAERGLSSFLLAVADGASDEDLQRAGDCWISAFETTQWSYDLSPERFLGKVTVKALGIRADVC